MAGDAYQLPIQIILLAPQMQGHDVIHIQMLCCLPACPAGAFVPGHDPLSDSAMRAPSDALLIDACCMAPGVEGGDAGL